jgi:hypothetical protein
MESQFFSQYRIFVWVLIVLLFFDDNVILSFNIVIFLFILFISWNQCQKDICFCIFYIGLVYTKLGMFATNFVTKIIQSN